MLGCSDLLVDCDCGGVAGEAGEVGVFTGGAESLVSDAGTCLGSEEGASLVGVEGCSTCSGEDDRSLRYLLRDRTTGSGDVSWTGVYLLRRDLRTGACSAGGV